jgi:hypothetical protein
MSWGDLVLTNVVDLPDNLHQSPLHSDVTKSMEMVAVPFNPKLYLVSKEGNDSYVKGFLRPMPVTRDSLNQHDVFVLDSGWKIYVWSGEHASTCEKINGNLYADHEESKRGSDPATLTHDVDDMFWDLLDGNVPICESKLESNYASGPASAPIFKMSIVDSVEIVDNAAPPVLHEIRRTAPTPVLPDIHQLQSCRKQYEDRVLLFDWVVLA